MGTGILTSTGSSSSDVTVSGGGIAPSICEALTKTVSGTSVSLKWSDPDDTVIDSQYLCSWGGTKIVRKAGSYPANESDGTVIVNNTTKNQYQTAAYVDTLPDTTNTYYYAAFPYSTNDVYCYNSKNQFSDAIIYGYYIDTTDSNPATRVHYIEDNINFTSAYMNFASGTFQYGSWKNAFFMPTPVMLKYNGTEDYALCPDDYTKKADGSTASDVSNTAYGGNAMMRFPRIWTKRYTSGNYQYVLKSNKQIDNTWKAYSWYNKNNVLLDYCYMNIYQPANISSVLRSLSGQTILTNAAGATEVAYATANGSAWYTDTFADWIEIQELLVLMGKSTDTQSIFGNGRSSAANATTGEANAKGLFYGTQSGTNGMLKIFGMENWYGNYWKRIAGCVYTSSGYKIKMTEGTQDGSTVTGYNSDGTGYIVPSVTMSGTSGGYCSAATQTAYGLLPTVANGSSSTYFCDGLWFAAGSYALVGGSYNNGLLAGAFALHLDGAFSDAYTDVGASLSCRPL